MTMIDLFGPVSPGARAALAVALDAALKATMLIVLALTAHAALGRRRALVRSALWNACLLGLLLLPVASLAFPRLRIAVWPAKGRDLVLTSAPSPKGWLPDGPPLVEARSIASGPIVSSPAPPTRAPASIEAGPANPAPGPVPHPGVAGPVLGLYLAVAALLLFRLAASLAAVGRWTRRCPPVVEPTWDEALGRWRAALGIGRRVRLRKSDRVSVPIVLGWLRPAIVVPEALAGTSDHGLVDAVLVHELGHVRRGDFGWNLVRRLVQLVYWPHPLTWPIGRIVGAVREQACDDLCVHVLGGATTYRTSLVAVASGLVRRPDPALGLAMARELNLGRRLAWIDRTRGAPRCLLCWPARLALAATVVALAGVLGSIELAHATAKAAGRSDEPTAKAVEEPGPAEEPKANPDAPPTAIEVVVVAGETGKPLEGATVRPSLDLVTSERKTDRDGRVHIDLSGRRFRDTLNIDVWAEGRVQQRHFFAQNDARHPRIPARVTIALLPGVETLGGQVADEQGRPIAGVKVGIWGYLGEKKEEHEMAYMLDATTDERGRWRCRCFRDMQFAFLYLSHPNYVSDDDYHPRRHGQPRPSNPPQPGDQPLAALRDFSDVQVMTRGVAIAGSVADEQGRPIAGAEVGWFEADQRDTFHHDMPATTTDAEGRFRFPHVRPGRLVLQVKARGHAPELKAVEAKEGMETVALKLGPPRTLAGRVVDSQGKPIADVFVAIDTWRGYRALGVFLKTDADGCFRWEDAPPDPVLIGASRAGYDGVSRRRVSPDEGEAILTLKRSLSISGRVRDAATGKPIDRAEVEVGTPGREPGEVSWRANPRVFAFQGNLQATLDAETAPEYRLRIKAKGYVPFESRAFRNDEGQVEYDVKLTKSDQPEGDVLSGVVRRPDGTPLAGAEVAVTYPLAGRPRLPAVHIEDGKIRPSRGQTIVKTDAQGRFALTREPDPAGRYHAVVVVHPGFHAEADRAAFEADPAITARPWGRVEGIASIGGKPAAGADIRYFADRLGNPDVPYLSDSGRTTTDAGGRFVLDRVVPGDVRVSLGFGARSNPRAWSNGTLVDVRAGETARARIGGMGRPVVARIVPPEGFDPKADYTINSEFEIESDRPSIPYPKELRARHDESMITWARRWWASAEGHAYRRDWFRLGQAKLQPDGTIRAEDVPPGDYRLRLIYSADPIYGPVGSPERIAHATKQFTIPAIPGGKSDEPFDAGVLRPKPKQALKVGQMAPPFEVETLDGRRLKLGDFRGKYLLLDFWATWCGPCIAEVAELKGAHDRFGKDARFAILSLSLDSEKEAPRRFAAEKGLAWAQGFLGDWVEGGVQDAYHVEAIPSTFLIGPDGVLIAKELRGDAIGAAVARALKAP